jgi:deoxyribose-phosphate aldolase
MMLFEPYSLTPEQLTQRAQQLAGAPVVPQSRQEILKRIFSCIDLTTLEGSDNRHKVELLCQKAAVPAGPDGQIVSVAAVCVYPSLVAHACRALEGTGIRVASVAGGFPSGQTSLPIKQAEVKYALAEGAAEIDVVISRGKLLEGNDGEVLKEIRAIREACGKATLKVILETGELGTHGFIRQASQLAMLGGADFIKTSTGKIPAGASLEAVLVMTDTIREYYEKTGVRIGIKPSGGISDIDTAMQYYNLIGGVLGNDWLTPALFRVGASRLASQIAAKVL